MQVILVQPPDTVTAETVAFLPERPAPPWDLLCLQAYLRSRTGHTGHVVDARLFTDFEADFVRTVQRIPAPRALVVHACDIHLGEAMAVVETMHRHFPDAPIALCGPYPSAHPLSAAALPHVQFALAGDPEPILRSLLDFLHVPNRLRQIPGLFVKGGAASTPAWLPDLSVLPTPSWDGIPWNAYQTTLGRSITAELRLSRGHSGTAADRAIGGADQPLRFWRFERLASLVPKCAHKGVVEIRVTDPPGIWTPDRLRDWCHALIRERNSHPWMFRTLPRQFSQAEIDTLHDASCRRIELILPSCDAGILQRFECLHERRRLAAALRALHAGGLAVTLHIWVGGPEEGRGERRRIVSLLRSLGFPHYMPQPFPLAFDSPLFREREPDRQTPTVEEWIAWSCEPWLNARPVPAWGGAAGADAAERTCISVIQRINRSPARRLLRSIALLRGINPIDDIENRMIGFFRKPASPPTEHGG